MTKAIIFDLNGVFIHSPKLSERFEKDFGVPTAEFLPKLSEIMEKVRRPNAGRAFSYWEPALKEWGIKLSEKEFWDYWFGAETPSQKMIALAGELKQKGIMIITLSNNFKERAEYYGHYPWMHEIVTKAYFSWQTGLVKPDVEAWKLVLAEQKLKPEECLYFDDQEKNLKAAESVGIKSFMFTSSDDAKKIISFFSEGFVHVYIWSDKPNTNYPEHAHKGKVSFFVIRGSVTFSGDIRQTLNADERFDVPVGARHFAVVGPDGCDWIVGEEIEGDS